MIFPGTEMILSTLQKNNCKITFFQSPGTTPDCHEFHQDPGMHLTGTHRLMDVQVYQVALNLIFAYTGRDIASLVPTFQPLSLRGMKSIVQ